MGGGRDFVHPGSPISDGDSSNVVADASLETEVPHFHGFERIRYSRAELLQLQEAVEIPEDILKIKQEFESEIKAAGEFMTMRLEKARSIPCKAYLIGSCQFGDTCCFSHEGHYQRKCEIGQVELNSSGLPLRPGEKVCPYYKRSGICTLLTSCWFHHPDPTITEQDLFSESVIVGSPRTHAAGAPHLPEMPKTLNESICFSNPSQAEMSFAQSLNSSSFLTDCQASEASGLDLCSPATDCQSSIWNGPSNVDYTERHAQPKCINFLEYGTCKFGSKCKYKHPESSALNSSSSLADNAILRQAHIDCPERHDQPNCTYFLKFGTCKFGSTCKYQHLTPSGLNSLTYQINAPVQREAQMEGYTGRADQSDCLYFLTYGTCQYGSACKYKHPQSLTINGSSSLADGRIQRQVHMDNTERHDQSDCTYFMKFGTCKFGSTCKYPHSMSSGLNGRTSQINAPIQCQAHMEHYTQRTDQLDCPYFVKNGTCQYGSTCKYRHTRCLALNCPSQGDEPIQRHAHMDYTEMHKQPDCTYFMKFGTCKFGSTCKYQHHNISSGSKGRTSHIDDPIQRQAWMEDYTKKSDQLDCPYFTTYGTCKYGSTCKYKHPRFLALNGRPTQTDGQIQRQTCLDFTESHPSPSEGQRSELDGPIQQQAHMENCKERPGQLDCLYFMKNGMCQFGSTCNYKHSQSSAKYRHPVPSASNGTTTWQANLVRPQVQMDEYPLRPDEPVCSYFVKYGTCKFKSACKFNYPPLNEYPQRPGEPECSHFTKFGTCKFKYACKFHHPTPSTLSGLTAKADGPIHQEQSEYPLRPERLECVNVVKHGTSKCYHSLSTTLDGLTLEADGGVHHLGKMERSKRPGELDCPSTMKFGHCSFGDACKYNHPNDCQPKVSSCIISSNGLPLRPVSHSFLFPSD